VHFNGNIQSSARTSQSPAANLRQEAELRFRCNRDRLSPSTRALIRLWLRAGRRRSRTC